MSKLTTLITQLARTASVSALLLAAVPAMAGPGTRPVNCSRGESLQRAVDRATPGGVIEVVGECNENVVVTTDHIRLVGVGPDAGVSTPDNGGLFGFALVLRARGVAVENMTILGGVLVENGGPGNLLLNSPVKLVPVALRIDDGQLEVRDGYFSGSVHVVHGSFAEIFDSSISGQIGVYHSSFAGVYRTDVEAPSHLAALALSATSHLLYSGGQIDGDPALDAAHSKVTIVGATVNGYLVAQQGTFFEFHGGAEQHSALRANRIEGSTLNSTFETVLLDTELSGISSALFQHDNTISALTCTPDSVAYCYYGATVTGSSTCSGCPSP